jgi:hypothetical protein
VGDNTTIARGNFCGMTRSRMMRIAINNRDIS